MHQVDIGTKYLRTHKAHVTLASDGLLGHPQCTVLQNYQMISASDPATLAVCPLYRVSRETLAQACINYSHPTRALPVYNMLQQSSLPWP